jgi:hypothetical protein
MSSNLITYEDKYKLESYEALFIQHFKETHSLQSSLSLLTANQQNKVNASLRTGKSDLAKVFREFVETAPVHPEANKVVILDNLIWIMNQSKEDKDTNGVLRAINEINKMIKGNLVSSTETKVIKQQILGVIDLSKPKQLEETTIDVTEDSYEIM